MSNVDNVTVEFVAQAGHVVFDFEEVEEAVSPEVLDRMRAAVMAVESQPFRWEGFLFLIPGRGIAQVWAMDRGQFGGDEDDPLLELPWG